MELIKKIKEAEAQAQEIIAQAKAESAGQAEENRKNRLEAIVQAEHERRKAIEAAVSKAESQGSTEAEGLKTKAEKNRQQLRKNAEGKMSGAVSRVMDYVKG